MQTRYSTSKNEFCIYVESADYKNILEAVGDFTGWQEQEKSSETQLKSKLTTEIGLIKANPIKSLTNLKLGRKASSANSITAVTHN